MISSHLTLLFVLLSKRDLTHGTGSDLGQVSLVLPAALWGCLRIEFLLLSVKFGIVPSVSNNKRHSMWLHGKADSDKLFWSRSYYFQLLGSLPGSLVYLVAFPLYGSKI